MSTILELPTEILADIVRHANLSGDLPSLRLTHSRLLQVAINEAPILIKDLCSAYGIGSRVWRLYALHKDDISFAGKEVQHAALDGMRLSYFLYATRGLALHVGQAASRELQTTASEKHLGSRELLLLFAVFTKALNSSLTIPHSTVSDLLAPSMDGRSSVSKRFSARFVNLLGRDLSLEELEGIIAAISECAVKAWGSLFMFRNKDSISSSFGGLSGASFNTDQAVLTEHIIWKGPLWVAKILTRYESAGTVVTDASSDRELDDSLVTEGVWKRPREEGARLAANGVARLLWRERQLRIDAKPEVSVQEITVMRVSHSVWRGSAGDM